MKHFQRAGCVLAPHTDTDKHKLIALTGSVLCTRPLGSFQHTFHTWSLVKVTWTTVSLIARTLSTLVNVKSLGSVSLMNLVFSYIM